MGLWFQRAIIHDRHDKEHVPDRKAYNWSSTRDPQVHGRNRETPEFNILFNVCLGVRVAIRKDVMVHPVIVTLEGGRRSSPAT